MGASLDKSLVTTQHGYPLDSQHYIRERIIVNKRCFSYDAQSSNQLIWWFQQGFNYRPALFSGGVDHGSENTEDFRSAQRPKTA